MPRMIDNTLNFSQQSGNTTFTFSAVRPEELDATEYTLATVVVDETGSVYDYADQLLEMIKASVKACRKSPRADNLMLRAVAFNDTIRELHGFKPVMEIRESEYQPLRPEGMTALYDATYEAVGAIVRYGETLNEYDLDVNGIVFIITDGYDNRSGLTAKAVAQKLAQCRKSEVMESIQAILIGINARDYRAQLEKFKQQAQLTQYIDAGDVTPANLARLGAFISKSISCQSQALGTGSAAPSLVF